jgi:O-antigen ligase
MTTLPTIVSEPAARPSVGPSRVRRDRYGLLLGAYAFLLAVVWSNRVFNWFFLPKAALGLCIIGPGLVALVWLLTRRDPPAVAATAFLLLAGFATALAAEPAMSFYGEYFTLNGFVLVMIGVAAWALGRTARGRAGFVEIALLAGATVNAAVAWLQVSTDLGVEGLGLRDGRAQGLMGNPVFLAGLCAGGLCIALARERTAARPLVYVVLTGFLTGAIELSGSRISLAAALLVIVWFVVAHLRHAAWSRAILVVIAAVAGLAIAQVPGSADASSVQRVSTDASNGLAPRLRLWQSAIEAVGERPVLGYGPGRSLAATSPRRSLTLARYEGPDVLFSDTHNFLVEQLTTTGVLGFAAFLAWLVLAARRVRGPLAGFAAVGAFTMLFEPLNVGFTPIVLLAFGAAGADAAQRALVDGSWLRSRPAIVVSIATLAAGAVAGALLVSGDMHYRVAVRDLSIDELSAAEQRFPPWPHLPGVRAQMINARAPEGERAIRAEREAIARDSDDPRWWYALGVLEEQRDRPARAERAYQQALERNPWSVAALSGLFRLALGEADQVAATRIRATLCRLGPNYCPPRSALNRRQPDPGPAGTPRPSAAGS